MPKPRILVVEEDKVIRGLYREFLGRDFEVLMAGTGTEAVAIAQSGDQQVDLMVADLDIADVNGTQLIAALPAGTPVFVVTCHLEAPEFGRWLRRHMPAVAFRKPFSFAGLEKAIGAALRPQT